MKKLTLLFIFIFQVIFGQQKQQPKVGLILSGGGAKGLAHIGVLKEIDKAGLQIDYIGGTSMGAIIGGLYASGYSAIEIEKLVDEVNFYTLLQDDIPREDKPLFEKEHNENHAISLPIKNGSIGIPRGVSKGQNLINYLNEKLSHVDEIDDFSKLKIPFFCIATNVEDGTKVVFEKGSLPIALRASSSFPTLLHPIEVDGKLLVDGGIANNFPAEEMIKKGVDIVIGVDVQSKLAKKQELNSVLSIINQIINFQMYNKSESQKKHVNIYVQPNIKDFSVISFEDSKKIIANGTKVGKLKKNVFDSIAKLQINKQPTHILKPKISGNLINKIVINGNNRYSSEYILGKLKLEVGDYVTYQDLSKKINALTATRNFKHIDYHFEKTTKGKKLVFNIVESDITAYLRMGIHYDFLYKSGVLLNYEKKGLLFRNDIFSFDLVVGDRIRYDFNYLIDNGMHWSYGLHSSYNQFDSNYKFINQSSINRVNIDYKNYLNGFYIQPRINNDFSFNTGLYLRMVNARSETFLTRGNATVFDDSSYLVGNVKLKLDTYDKSYFAKSGYFFEANFDWYFWSTRSKEFAMFYQPEKFTQFSQIKATFSSAQTFYDKLTFEYLLKAGYTLGKEETQIFDFRLGGYNKNYFGNFTRFYGYEIASLSDQAFLKIETEFRYEFLDKHYAIITGNIARVTNESIFEKGSLTRDLKSGYAVGYGLETFLGPIELKYSWSPEGKSNFWLFNLGFWF